MDKFIVFTNNNSILDLKNFLQRMILATLEGFHIHHYKEISSTNTEALDLIDKEIFHETVIIADKQTKGRGRYGRSWLSQEGNFYASLIIKQEINLTVLAFISALAVGNTLLELINSLNIQYKWPNDILIDSKKVSGILLEKKSNSDWLVIGIGINTHHAPLHTSTSISHYSLCSIEHTSLLKKLLINFNTLKKDKFDLIRKAWLNRAFKLKEYINIKLADELFEGVFIGIDEYGKLILQDKNNGLICFDTGETCCE